MHFDPTVSLGSIFAALTIILSIVVSSFRIAGKIFSLFEKVDRRLELVEKSLAVIAPRTEMLYEAELKRRAVAEFIEKEEKGDRVVP